MTPKYLVLASLGLIMVATPLQPVAAASCVTDPTVRTQVTHLQNDVTARTAAYQSTLQSRAQALKAGFNNFENKDKEIRGHWQGNRDQQTIKEIVQDQAEAVAAPVLAQIEADTLRFEDDLQNILERPISAAAAQCVTTSITKTLRATVRQSTYTGSTRWRDGWGTTMANYNVQVTTGIRVTPGTSQVRVSRDSVHYSARLSVQPTIRVSARIQSRRRDRPSVSFQKDIATSADRVNISINGQTSLTIR
ncbi:hypothetical protein BH11PAT4_BH11PAT4_6320 [soil metagenome]